MSDVELIGASVDAINVAEDRLKFRDAMREIGVDVPDSRYIKSRTRSFPGRFARAARASSWDGDVR